MSVRLRLTLWYTALLGLVLAGFAALVYFAVAQQLASQFEYAVHLRALEASRAAHASPLICSDAVSPCPQLPIATELADQVPYVRIVDPHGDVLTSSGSLAQPLPSPPSSLRTALGGQQSHTTLNLSGERLDVYSAPLLIDDRVVGVLQVVASLRSLEASLAQLRLILAGIVVGAMFLAAAIGWFLATRAMRPVDQLTQLAHAIGQSADLSKRLAEPRQRDELGRLAATFNEMLARLERSVDIQHRFLADASHELRTPLASVRTNAEALLRGVGEDPIEREDTLRAIAREADRMGRLVADLLVLARADAGQPIKREPLALDTILLEVYRQARRISRGVRLELGELEQVEVVGDSDRLRQLVLNLVDNALRYTPAGGVVTLDLVSRDGGARLTVRDTGPGIPAEHLPRIFERFYRADLPHSRIQGGTGLGLAICQRIARAHGGRIDVESQEGAGSVFTAFLPLSLAAGCATAVAVAEE